jgi:hypothetical protein
VQPARLTGGRGCGAVRGCRLRQLLQPEDWGGQGGGERLPPWAQSPSRHAGQRTCPQALSANRLVTRYATVDERVCGKVDNS